MEIPEVVIERSPLSSPVVDISIVIVTHNRASYLAGLLQSLTRLGLQPRSIVVVDNNSSDGTSSVITAAEEQFGPGVVINLFQPENVGGAGGFARGIAAAMDTGAEWIWLMDDDVEALPGALDALLAWGSRFKCIHGSRINADGTPFFFQPNFNTWLGVPLIYLQRSKGSDWCREINAGCFEGMFVHRDIVQTVGLPDARFFQTWDDAIYGWEISLVTPVVLVADVTLQRMRTQKSINLGIRHLNDASDRFRYLTMRNRAFVAEHLRSAGEYRAVGFGLGTLLVLGKELFRLWLVERCWLGVGALVRGWADSRKIMRSRRMPNFSIPHLPHGEDVETLR